MGCAGYGPLLSRYVDEDLGGKELEDLLEHLTECAFCQKELKGLEDLRSWFQTAEAFDAVPEVRETLDLEHLLGKGSALGDEVTGGAPIPMEDPQRPKHGNKRDDRKKGPSERKRFLHILNPFPSQNVWRYAFAMIAVVALGVWLYPGQPVEWIDVHKLIPEKTLTVKHLPRQEALGHNMDLYVMQHASNQPWAQYGDELPMIRQVSGSIQ